jgi:hypothetical protein
MWMPAHTSHMPGGGSISGVVDRLPQQVSERGGFLGHGTPATVFRLRTDYGEVVNCRLAGALRGTLDLGDRILVSGYAWRGVVNVTRITDERGAEIARTGCFVVTAVCGNEEASEVIVLRRFRDEWLLCRPLGWIGVAIYSRLGPWLAHCIRDRSACCVIARVVAVRPAAWLARCLLGGGRRVASRS